MDPSELWHQGTKGAPGRLWGAGMGCRQGVQAGCASKACKQARRADRACRQGVKARRADRACKQGVQAGCSSRACGQGGSGPAVMKGCSSAGSAAEGLAARSNDLSASAPPSGTCCLVGIDLTRVEEEITLSHPRRAGLGLPAWALALFPFPAGAKRRQGKQNRWRSGKKALWGQLGFNSNERDAASVRAPVPGHETQGHWKICRKGGKGEQRAVGLLRA